MANEGNDRKQPETQEPGEGHLLLNIGKFLFLVIVLTAFWYFFDKWLSGK